jgi:hypothetical protein
VFKNPSWIEFLEDWRLLMNIGAGYSILDVMQDAGY